MLDIGMPELIVIFIVALLVFGPKKLPELGKSLGKGLGELKRAFQDVKEQVETEFKDATSEVRNTVTDVKRQVETDIKETGKAVNNSLKDVKDVKEKMKAESREINKTLSDVVQEDKSPSEKEK